MDSKFYSAADHAKRRHEPPDFTTEDGVKRLQEKIEQALRRKGLKLPTFAVKYVPGPQTTRGEAGRPRFDLRSNMLNGFPPKGDAA